MQVSDLHFAAECTAREGWVSETRQEFEGFFAYDPQGCFIAEEDGQRIGICVATPYGPSGSAAHPARTCLPWRPSQAGTGAFGRRGRELAEFGFIGELIVVEAARGRGIGRRLLEHTIGYLQARGAQTIFLDGVPAAVSLYERVGFRRVCRSLRFYGHLPGKSHPHVRPMCTEDLDAVSALDQGAFGADRCFSLERRLALYPELGRVLEHESEIRGFILGRRAPGRVSAGPWVVRSGVASPGDLLESLALEVGNAEELSVGVMATNVEAAGILRSFGLIEHSESPWRMALGPPRPCSSQAQCYAIGSAAKG
jgi:ribosomal protein S18 acetylase RimI-like enzyme